MELDHHVLALIAVGASVAANCQPCLEYNVGMARRCGAGDRQIEEAIKVGKQVRQGAAAKFDKFAAGLTQAAPVPAGPSDGGCGCMA